MTCARGRHVVRVHPSDGQGASARICSSHFQRVDRSPTLATSSVTHGATTFATSPVHGCGLVAMGRSDRGPIDTMSRTGGREGRYTASTKGEAMSELQEFNQRVIREFRAHQGQVGGPLAQMPVLLLTMTGARSGR